jgi:hypothetical protein
MPGESMRCLVYAITLTLALAAGILLGQAHRHPGDPPHIFTRLGGISILMLMIGTVEATLAEVPLRKRLANGCVSAAAGVYCLATMTVEPFMDPPSEELAFFLLLMWLAPLVIAGLMQVHHRCWWSSTGTALFFFASIWLITLNLHFTDQSGFLTFVRQ